MENKIISYESLHYNNNCMAESKDVREVLSKYVDCKQSIEDVISWATDVAIKYYLRHISNTKSNIEETKFDSKDNVGIEYSKDSKNRLSYRNKPIIPTNLKYNELCDMIRITSGLEREILRYILFGVKCIHSNVEYDILKIHDVDYSDYFNVLDEKYNVPCPECKSKNTTPMMIQNRAGDEPPLVRHSCRDCKKHFHPPMFK
ncbi:RNA polymerase [Cetacean poxvirus 1]|nr:RNA polymerase [Cetacean poxvirus 1]